jgi:hypothetical protein
MALDNVSADAVATAICSALGVEDEATQAKWKSIMEAIYGGLKTDAIITIPSGAIVTSGSATTQTGPAAPVLLSLT